MTTPPIPAGVWQIDPAHTNVEFRVRHLGLAKVRGRFDTFEGTLTIADDPLRSEVEAVVDLASVDTNNEDRDNHLRSTDFFDIETHPRMTYRSTGIDAAGDGTYVVHGDLTVAGTSRPVDLALEFDGVGGDPWGGTRVGFTAEAEISRKDFGISFNVPLDGGSVLVGDKVTISLDVQAVHAPETVPA